MSSGHGRGENALGGDVETNSLQSVIWDRFSGGNQLEVIASRLLAQPAEETTDISAQA